jgi:uncharacterized surface protein with fasciclin (FAS1) repeats
MILHRIKQSTLAVATAVLAASMLLLAGCDSGGSGMEDPEPTSTLAETVSGNSGLSTLAAALEAAGKVETLDDEDATFTVFAPANSAFENVDVESLTSNPGPLGDLLDYHVVQGEALTASDLEGRESVTTVEGQELAVESSGGTITVGGVEVTQADVEASNGVAHVIGGVLIPDSFPRRVSYDLQAQSNSGAIPDGVAGTVTFWEAGDSQTLVTLSLDDGPTGASVSHPAHIHNGSASEGGGIEIYLSPLDGTNANDANDGTSARLVERPFDELAGFDGYVNIHESVENLGNVVSQGNVGANATGTLGTGLQLVDDPQTTTYPLEAQSNDGAIPGGVPGQVQLRELTAEMTLATVRLDPDGDGEFEDGATQGSEATVSHPAHIHRSDDGSIEVYLSPVDGSDPSARSSQIVGRSFGDLTSFSGYVNVHESAANLQNVVSQGNIGASVGSGDPSSADVTITIDNIEANAYEVTDVSGASGVAETGTNNPTLELTVGTRYRIDNNGGIGAHPFGVQNGSDEYLLRQESGETGSLEGDEAINYQEDDDGITFTYTQDLADAVSSYRCTFHSAMEGGVQTAGSDNGGGGGGY